MKNLRWTIGGIVGIFALSALASLQYKVFAPINENIRREAYEDSASYVQGKIQYLTRLRNDYDLASDAHKIGLKAIILREAATVDNSKLPNDLKNFIEDVK